MKKTEKKTLKKTASEFAMINWWVTWVAIIITSFYNYSTNSYLKSEFSKALEVMKLDQRGIVMLDSMGRPLVTKKANVSISDEAYKKALAINIQHNFTSDAISLTDNFKNQILSVSDIQRKNQKILDFKENFLMKDSKNVSRNYSAYLKLLVGALSNDNLPEQITVRNTKVTSYTTDGSSFKIKVSFNVIANAYQMKTSSYVEREGIINVENAGVIDSSLGTILNPLGIRYDFVQSTILSK